MLHFITWILNFYIWLDVWKSEFFVTRGVILKSVLFDFFFSFLDKYVSKALRFFFFYKIFFFSPGFSAIFVYAAFIYVTSLQIWDKDLLFYLRFGTAYPLEAIWQQFLSMKVIDIEVGFLKITLTLVLLKF